MRLGRNPGLLLRGVAAGLFVLACPVSGESPEGVVAGRVRSLAGSPVADTVVTARDVMTGYRKSAISDVSGAYWIGSLPAGVYDVTAEAPGFSTELVHGVSVGAGLAAGIDFTLRVVAPPSAPAPPAPVEPQAPPPEGQAGAPPPDTLKAGPRMQIYGYAQLDMIYDFDQVNPDWFDVLRPTQLPSIPNEFGENGNFWASVRQTRFGLKGWLPTGWGTGWGEVTTRFEFDLFGVGADAGQTTFHLRYAWGSIGPLLMGQADSVFMDSSVFPISIEYWGPNGSVAFRNPQLRYAPLQGDDEIFIALERPGATGDGGRAQERIDLENVRPRFPAPDLTMHYRHSRDWGHVQLAGVVRYIGWEDTVPNEIDLTGHAVSWGLNLSTNYKLGKTGTVRAQVVYGEGIENYLDDAPVDIGAATHLGNPRRPIVGEALPVFGLVAFYDFYWNDCFSSAVGYSRVDIDNSDLQLPSAFKTGQYGLVNLLYYPVVNVMTGFEFLWGRRSNFSDGFAVNDFRIQFSGRYSFDFELGRK